ASVPGRGSRFSILIPRVGTRRRRDERNAAGVPPSSPTVPFTSFAARCVAVIDDDPGVVAAMRALFSAWGATVAGGENAGAALSELKLLAKNGSIAAPKFDLVVADLRLANGRSGIDAVAELRQTLSSHAPALIVSGDTGEDARASVAKAG